MEQYIIVGAIVGASVIYLLRKAIMKTKKTNRSSCGGCNRCGGGSCH